MEFEKIVRPLVEAFVQEIEEALRAQLEARLLGDVAPTRPARRGRPPAAPHAFEVPAAPAASDADLVDEASAPVAVAPVALAPAPPSAPAASRTDPTIERILAFIGDNQDRTDEEGAPLRIEAALIASHLGLAPPLVKAVVDHLVTTRKLERRGTGRAAYYTRSVA